MITARQRSVMYSAAMAAAFLLPLFAAQAFSLVPTECQGTASVGECGLPELVGLFVRIAQYIFGISGSIALALFIYGGFIWLTSAGSPEKVQKGKNVITGAIIGLVIIFGAATMVRFLVETVRSGGGGGGGTSSALFQGESCSIGGEAGVNVEFTDGLRCVAKNPASCDGGDYELQPLGFAKTNLQEVNATEYECINGMFPDEGANIRCCRPLSADAASAAPAASGGAASPSTGAAARDGTCNCGLSVAGRLAMAAATDADIARVAAQCEGIHASFNRADMTCIGSSSQADCTRLNDSSPLISCDWTAR